MLRGYLIHVCGMFKIASYRIEQAFKYSIKIFDSIENEIMIYKEIICAVDIHCKAIKYSEFLLSSFEGSFLALTVISVICLSLNLFAIFHSVSIGNKEEFLFHLLIVLAIFVYMFIANYTGQEIMDHNNYIYITAYNVRWYVAPVYTQKLILFILQRSGKAVAVNFGNIIVVSLECFAMLLKASMSYFTFMYSTQH
ncbi:PREDICTED: odorant receptor 4-like [Atta colombica]|uniref:odorant receptor 4-like n=1 Tax=Atta colombica TaxID=520822 RepID=UPI00084CC9DC|nr:PREDICTED: odorant receptor 4-like [Atta colombica]